MTRLTCVAQRALYALLGVLTLGVCLVSARSLWLNDRTAVVPTLALVALVVCVLFAVAWMVRRRRRTDGRRAVSSEVESGGRRLAATQKRALPWMLPVLLAVVCFGVKLAFVLVFRVEPQGDYKTFYIVARDLASGGDVTMHRYVALFPHIFGYSAFLSLFFRVFGDGAMVAPVVNCVLSALSALMLFYIAEKLFSRRSAVFAVVVWTLFPSLTLFNIHALSEPLYTAELLLCALIFLRLHDELGKGRGITPGVLGYSAAIGGVLWLVGMARPIAAIPIIATAIILLVLDLPYRNLAGRLFAIALLCAVYFALGKASDAYIAHRLGEVASSTPGYSIAVGFNARSGGLWNAEDSNLLISYSNSMTAEQAQRAMLEVAKERVFSGEIDFVRLMYRKFSSLYSYDDTPVTSWGKETFSPHNGTWSVICNGFYLAMMALTCAFALSKVVKKSASPEHWFTLYFIGLTAAQMLVEVAYRYHYSAMITLCVAAAGIFEMLCSYDTVRQNLRKT